MTEAASGGGAAGGAAGDLVVGYGPDESGEGALRLGAVLARSAGRGLVVCCVVPDRWGVPSRARVDAEYADELQALARSALDEARDVLGDPPHASYVVRTGRSAPAVLLADAGERGAPLLVVGSSSHGAWGHIATGSVSDRLMPSAHLPLAVAPRGYHPAPDQVVRRVTVALDGTEGSTEVLLSAAGVAQRIGAEVRVVTFAVRGRSVVQAGVGGARAEDLVMAAWREQSGAALDGALAALAEQEDRPAALGQVERAVVEGRDWSSALESGGWRDGDVLVIGSSSSGPVARVFLGSTATRIVRHSPVPVALLPR